jgi:hypothetical protein
MHVCIHRQCRGGIPEEPAPQQRTVQRPPPIRPPGDQTFANLPSLSRSRSQPDVAASSNHRLYSPLQPDFQLVKIAPHDEVEVRGIEV